MVCWLVQAYSTRSMGHWASYNSVTCQKPNLRTCGLLAMGMQPQIIPKRPCLWNVLSNGRQTKHTHTRTNTNVLSDSAVGAGSEQTRHDLGEEKPGGARRKGRYGELLSIPPGSRARPNAPTLHEELFMTRQTGEHLFLL